MTDEDIQLVREATYKSPIWQSKAQTNVQKWGLQDPWTILGATFEELAEVGDELFEETRTDYPISKGMDDFDFAILDAIEAGRDVQMAHEAAFEDGDGNVDVERDPFTYSGENAERIADEIADTAALLFQLQAAIRRDADEL